MLSTDDIFSKDLIMKIKKSGFSSLPIYDKDRQNIIGCLRTKIILKCESKHLNKVNFKYHFIGSLYILMFIS